jgi:hypothetical protein
MKSKSGRGRVMGEAKRRRRRPTEAQFRRALRSDNCGGCGRRLRGIVTMASGYLDGRLVSVAACCIGRLSGIVAAGFYAETTGPAPWQTNDKLWFAANPKRTHRLRPAMEGEDARGTWIAVRQISPGQRVRCVFNPKQPFSPDEATAKAIFDRFAAAQPGAAAAVTIGKFVRSRIDGAPEDRR